MTEQQLLGVIAIASGAITSLASSIGLKRADRRLDARLRDKLREELQAEVRAMDHKLNAALKRLENMPDQTSEMKRQTNLLGIRVASIEQDAVADRGSVQRECRGIREAIGALLRSVDSLEERLARE